jgi:hypothetical protein
MARNLLPKMDKALNLELFQIADATVNLATLNLDVLKPEEEKVLHQLCNIYHGHA